MEALCGDSDSLDCAWRISYRDCLGAVFSVSVGIRRIIMWVSNIYGSYWRTGSEGEIRRNGDFIDVWFTQDGIRQWISIPESRLKELLATAGHGQSVSCYISFDEPADDTTRIKDLLRTRRMRELMGELK